MNLGTQELRRLYRELEPTLTPKQRELMVVGALHPSMLTPTQLEIVKKMEPYLNGLTPEQSRQLGMLDTFAEGYEAGQQEGTRVGLIIGIAVVILIAVVVLNALLR
jgi:hypothetical protein